ncbi:MAG: hypothetical protein CMB67_03985 [Euryarchaeota archaeon]|nr:hypothetical protein [Euryarchaeota archaeon]
MADSGESYASSQTLLGSCEFLRPPETIEEELAIIAEALDAGIDPFPPKKPPSRYARIALGWFMVIMMVSWVSQLLYRYVS